MNNLALDMMRRWFNRFYFHGDCERLLAFIDSIRFSHETGTPDYAMLSRFQRFLSSGPRTVPDEGYESEVIGFLDLPYGKIDPYLSVVADFLSREIKSGRFDRDTLVSALWREARSTLRRIERDDWVDRQMTGR